MRLWTSLEESEIDQSPDIQAEDTWLESQLSVRRVGDKFWSDLVLDRAIVRDLASDVV